jgi:hypothetical protein
MRWRPPEEIGDVLLIAAGALTVGLLCVQLVTQPPLFTAEDALSYSISQLQ